MPQPPRVQLFITCIVDSLFPQVGEAVIDVLKRLGVDVEFPEAQTCCGQPAYNAGFRDEAREAALHFMNVFSSPPSVPPLLTASFDFAQDARSGEGGWGGEAVPYILTPSGSCAAMIVHGYRDLFAGDPANLARARAVAARTYEFSQFLVDILKVEDVGASLGSASRSTPLGQDRRFGGPLTYHPSCHLLRGLGVKDAPTKLLSHVREAEIVPLPNAEECCGFGGLFAIKHGDISSAILDRKLENIRATKAATVVGCDMSCLMHIQGALSRDGSRTRCVHLAEVLAADG